MNRTPSIDVIRTLRKENGYKCVIPECEIPYLEYHHFDPPWHVENHHRPEGMIALCPEHHRKADGGSYTDSQLKEFKANARKEFEKIEGRFEYLRNKILLVAGGNFYLNNKVEVRIQEKDAIWFETDDNGYKLLNINLYDKANNLFFKIENNVWEIIDNVNDIECPPNGKLLNIHFNNGDKLGLEFKELKDISDIEKILKSNPHLSDTLEDLLPITVLNLSIKIQDYEISFQKDKTMIGNTMMTGCFSEDSRVAVSC